MQSAITQQAEALTKGLKLSQAVDAARVVDSVERLELNIKTSLDIIEQQTRGWADLEVRSKLEEQTAAIRTLQTSIVDSISITQQSLRAAQEGAVVQSQRPATTIIGDVMAGWEVLLGWHSVS